MPNRFKPVVYLRRKIEQLYNRDLAFVQPIYSACTLLALAGVLLFFVVSSLASVEQMSKNSPSTQPMAEQANGSSAPFSREAAPVDAANGQVGSSEPRADAQVSQTTASQEKAVWPLQGTVRHAFGWQQHPVFHDWRYHAGVDIDAPEDSPVQAMLGGQVADIYTDVKYGLTVLVTTDVYSIRYASLHSVDARLTAGSRVDRGQSIGTAGSCSVEPYSHLHLSVQQGDQQIDPQTLMLP